MERIVLWDIDNTLLYTGGAGSVGMARAFRDLYGVEDAFKRVEFSGRTDTAIFRDAAREHGLDEATLVVEQARFVDAYIPHLRSALSELQGRLMPGIEPLLKALAATRGVAQGLGTGNFRRGGELKLQHYGIAEFFPGCIGGFGEDSEFRDEVIGMAIERVRSGNSARAGVRVIVIGDTPHDVTAAKAHGAYAFAVATGRNSREELLSLGADSAFENLSDTEEALAAILGA